MQDINCKEPSDDNLHLAVMNGDKDMVKMILEKGANIEYKNEFGRTPLYHAIEKKNLEVTELLLKHRAGVNVSDKHGESPLHVAVQTGCLQIIELLLKYGANNDCLCSSTSIWKGYAPLHLAVENGSEEVVTLLLSRGASVDFKTKYNITPLYIAVKNEHFIIVKEILNFCPDINNQSNKSSLEIAVQGKKDKYKEIVEVLLEYGFVVNSENADNPELLLAAVEKGYLKIIEDLLKYGADVNMLCNKFRAFGSTLLHIAAKDKQEEVAKLLISYGADINVQDVTGKTPIFYAIENADSKFTKLLLTNRANIKDSSELLNIAVEMECVEIVEALLQHDADVNARDKYGRTALHYTICRYHTNTNDNIKAEIAKLLLTKGANVDAQTKHGKTTLHFGAQKGYQKVIETLLEFGADINLRDKHGRTALHIASQKGHFEVVATLLKYGSDININTKISIKPSRNYRTALDLAMARLHPLYDYDDNYGWDSDDDYNYDYDEDANLVTAKTLKCHIVKMITANLYVSKQNLLSLCRSYRGDLVEFQAECREEIASMKSKKINNTTISFHDIFAKDTISLEIYMRNENTVQVLKSEECKVKFPIYASLIGTYFKKAMERKELLEQSNKIFHFLVNNFPKLPYDCTEKIFSYLSNEDLRTFVKAGRNARTPNNVI